MLGGACDRAMPRLCSGRSFTVVDRGSTRCQETWVPGGFPNGEKAKAVSATRRTNECNDHDDNNNDPDAPTLRGHGRWHRFGAGSAIW